MPISPDFLELLGDLFQQMGQDSDAPPDVPRGQWPADSAEESLLADFQALLAVLHARSQNRKSQVAARLRR